MRKNPKATPDEQKKGSPKFRSRAVAYALQNGTDAAAKLYGVSPRTIGRWLAAVKQHPGAKLPKGTATKTEARLDEIVERMASGRWVAGKSHVELSRAWGISTSQVENLATEAHRVIKRLMVEVRDPETVRDRIDAALSTVVERSLTSRGNRPVRNAIDALELQAKVHGLITTKSQVEARVETTTAETEDGIAIAEALEARAAQLRAEAAAVTGLPATPDPGDPKP